MLFRRGRRLNPGEMADHVTDPTTHVKLMAERVAVLKTI